MNCNRVSVYEINVGYEKFKAQLTMYEKIHKFDIYLDNESWMQESAKVIFLHIQLPAVTNVTFVLCYEIKFVLCRSLTWWVESSQARQSIYLLWENFLTGKSYFCFSLVCWRSNCLKMSMCKVSFLTSCNGYFWWFVTVLLIYFSITPFAFFCGVWCNFVWSLIYLFISPIIVSRREFPLH